MKNFAAWIARHRKLVVFAWIGILIGTGILAGAIGSDFNEDFKPPKSDSQQAYDMLAKNYPAQSGDTGQLVFRSERGVKDPETQQRIEDALAKIEKVKGIGTTISPYSPAGAQQVSPDGKTAFATINWKEFITQTTLDTQVDPVIEIIEDTRTDGLRVEGGGGPFQFAQQSESGGAEVVGVAVAMVVLFIMFGTFLAMGMPIVTALIAVSTSMSLIAVLSNLINTAEFATFLSIMIGLGVGIDYALFVVTRFRQNMRHGIEPTEAVVLSMDTAGRAVLFAGVTVMIALLGLFLVGMNFLYGPALAASMTVLVTMIASLTLLPALLVIAGPRVNYPFFPTLIGAIKRNYGKFGNGHVISGIVSIPLLIVQAVLLPLSFLFYGLVIWLPQSVLRLVRIPVPHRSHAQIDEGENAHPRWHKWSSWVQQRPWPVAIATTAVLIVLSIPAFSMNLGVADSGTDPKEMTSRQAYDLLAAGFGAGFNGPMQVVIDSSAGKQKIKEVTGQLDADPGVATVLPATTSPNGEIYLITIFPTTSPQSTLTNDLVHRIRDDLAPLNEAGHKAHVAGITAVFDDFSTLITKKLPIFIGAVVLLSALLLMAVFRSIAIPLKAIAMNLLGILAAFGVTVAIFQWGWGASFVGVDSTAPIIAFLPVMMFAIVFGLSMDYEVFLMSRVHEEWERTKDADEAVIEGVSATGGTITAAAIIMVSLFASFAVLSNDLTTKLFGVSLATTIFLDAFIIRSALVPAVMAILGDKAWWMPGWLDRVLPRVHVEPVAHDEVPATQSPAPAEAG
ncbi:MAG: MMPL family transporter [Actinobacteria bacterium]|nr:MMPL family transporter [Actinomycetota bacterium]